MKNKLMNIIMSKLPDMKFTEAVFLILCIPFLALIYSCESGLLSGSDHVIRNNPVDMGSYTVSFPAGDDWQCRTEKSFSRITLTRNKSSVGGDLLGVLAAGNPEGSTVIEISENRILSDSFILAVKDAAEDYMNEELNYMNNNGAKGDMYDIVEVAKTDTVINDKIFYCMKYELSNIKNNRGAYFTSDNLLALYYPVDYPETRRFYVFMINDYSNSILIGRDAGQLYTLLADFKLKTEVLTN